MKRFISIAIFALLFAPCFTAAPVDAAEYSLKQMTPQVEDALSSRKARFDKLESYKAQGLIGENNRGYVESLGGDAQAAEMVAMENKDRKVIYQTIAEQNGITGQIDVIEKVFAQVQHEKASAGYKIQDDAGQWKTK